MKIEVGQKLKTGEIVWVSDDKRVFAVHTPDDLGKKGVIWGKMFFQKPSDDDRQKMWNAGIQHRQFGDIWYMVLDTADDYPQIFSKCIKLVTDNGSAYAYPEPLVMET